MAEAGGRALTAPKGIEAIGTVGAIGGVPEQGPDLASQQVY